MRTFTYPGRDGCPLFATSEADTGIDHGPDTRPPVVALHGGGPDHRSMLPLARRLADRHRVVLPDIRGYGRSVCADPARHTWDQYADDVITLLDHQRLAVAAVIGAGLGGTIALRAAAAYPDRISAVVVVSLEDIEDDEAKAAETVFLDAFARRVADEGIAAGWEPILADFAPLIGTLVREAIPRSDPASIAAAAAIGHDRAFRRVADLAAVTVPALIVSGSDARHPTALAAE
ncbi:MAG: alpha/beta hydrolase, partial [Streptomycetaceae bacterium]|nr:alpha/beta hydrolase [Streptomycetaceae bacterium]